MKSKKRIVAQETRFNMLMAEAKARGLIMPDQALELEEKVKAKILGIKKPNTSQNPLADLEKGIADYDQERGLSAGGML